MSSYNILGLGKFVLQQTSEPLDDEDRCKICITARNRNHHKQYYDRVRNRYIKESFPRIQYNTMSNLRIAIALH